jgi:O-antigen/teichoic acid export membrane protein
MKKALIIAATNQAISSGTTFGLTLLLINQINKNEFGIYALTFASILFFTGLGNALFLLNLSIKLGTIRREKQNPLIERTTRSTLLYGLLVTTLATFLLVIASKLIPQLNHTIQTNAIPFGLTIGCYVTLTLIKDLQTRIFYAEESESRVLIATTIYSAIIFTTILASIELNITIITDAKSALLLQCSALVAAIVTGIKRLSKSTLKTSIRKTGTQFKHDLLQGADAGKANTINWLRSYGFNWLTGIWGGPIAVAQINASRLMITPPTLILTAIGQPLLARLSRSLRLGKANTVSLANKAIYAALTTTLLYAAPVLMFHDHIVDSIFGPQYAGSKSLTYLWVIFILFSSVSTISTITLQALKEFDYLKKNALISLAILIITVYPLYKAFEVPGILAAVAISEAFLGLRLLSKILNEGARQQHEES